jgi:cytochrome P450
MSESTMPEGDLSNRARPEDDARSPGKRPRLRGLPILGNALDMALQPLEFLTRVAREQGDVARFSLIGQDVYLLSHPDAIEEVLKHGGDDLQKDDFTRGLSVAVGQGLLTSEGEFWRRQRKLAQPAFHHHRVRAYAETMVQHAERTARAFTNGETRDVHADMMRLTLDIVAETLFGTNVGPAAHQISEALEVMMERFQGFRSLIPLWVPTPGSRRALRALRTLDEVVYGIIRARRESATDRGDLLSMLLAATTEEGGGMSDEQLRDEVVTLLMAGHETTALTLTFTLHALARHPEVGRALAEEIATVLGDRAATFADLPNLPYADAVVRESMRLYPPAWAIGRAATKHRQIAGVPCEPGTQLWISQWVVHRDPRWFADPEAFRPERWRGDLARRLPRFAYFPFGGGPRVCIGNAFAMMEAVLLLVTLTQQVRLHAEDARPLEFSPSVTLRPKGAVRMRVERLSAATSAP